MQLQKSPGGSLFPYYYKGGELHALKYGSFHKNHATLYRIMDAERDFILNSGKHFPIWVDFYETKISREVLIKFIENISDMKNSMIRLAVVGFSYFSRLRFMHLLKKSSIALNMPIRFFADPEVAKTWLVNEK